MSTLSSMQRSITNQDYTVTFGYVVLFVLYSSLSSIYHFLPPMLAVLFMLFTRALGRNDFLYVLIISFCLVVFEANNGYRLFSSIIYFYIIYKFILPKIVQNFSCNICVKVSYLLLSYIGYFLFLTLISSIFLLPAPELNYYIVYYIVIEFFLVSLL
jgi:hypothetical protein